MPGCAFTPAVVHGEAETARRNKAWCAKVCAANSECGVFDTQAACVADDDTGYAYAGRARCTPVGWYVVGGVTLLGLLLLGCFFCHCHFLKKRVIFPTRLIARQVSPPGVSHDGGDGGGGDGGGDGGYQHHHGPPPSPPVTWLQAQPVATTPMHSA